MTVTYPSNVWSFDPISCWDDEDPSLAIILSLHESRDLDGIYVKLQIRWLENVYVLKVINLSEGNQYLQSKRLKRSDLSVHSDAFFRFRFGLFRFNAAGAPVTS